MNRITQIPLPLEVAGMITAYLRPHHLASCVQVNHEWARTFLPFPLEKHPDLRSPPPQFKQALERPQPDDDEERSQGSEDDRAFLFGLGFNGQEDCYDDCSWDDDEDLYRYRSMAPDRWFNCTRSKVENAALEKYGHLVRKIKCETYKDVVLLETHAHTCTDLLELEIWSPLNNPSLPLPDLDLEPVMAILQHTVGLQTLRIHGSILSESNTDLVRMIDAIPLAVKRLELCSWDPIYDQREYSCNQNQEQVQSTPSTTTTRNLKHRLSQHPYFDSHISPSTATQSTITRVSNLHILEWCDSYDKDFAALLDASQTGWRTFGYPRSRHHNAVFGYKSSDALLRNASTLENVRLDSAYDLSGATVQRLFCSAPRLKRFGAIAEDRTRECDFSLDAQDIVEGGDWVCTGLESLKIQINGVPRPDVKFHSNGRTFDNQLLHEGTMEDIRKIQSRVYTQLRRFT
ncbi:hypothetical protein BGZ96_009639 [Linnemannia gamsii]|uniref:F-box domain-containing protein n=1 Tax=Linnemannia gamsii TaxID=64522 RepID=A0ABQ7JWN1_9FUNG|nr:hypothetical protein BGZ96_009639 [Linnemannia gamsii]